MSDYAALIGGSSRYAAARNTGSDVRAFATALKQGGYATDPDYVQKIVATADSVRRHLGSPALKPVAIGADSAAGRPAEGSGDETQAEHAWLTFCQLASRGCWPSSGRWTRPVTTSPMPTRPATTARWWIWLARTPARSATNWVGNGVDVTSIRRLYDQTLTDAGARRELLAAAARYLRHLRGPAGQAVQRRQHRPRAVAAAVQQRRRDAVAPSPSSATARQVVLSQSQTLVNRLKGFQTTIDTLSSQLGSQLGAEASTINSLSQGVATLNQQIVAAHGSALQSPNDLLDQRDALLTELRQSRRHHHGHRGQRRRQRVDRLGPGAGHRMPRPTALSVAVGHDGSLRTAPDRWAAPRRRPTSAISSAAAPSAACCSSSRSLLTPAQNALGQVAVAIADAGQPAAAGGPGPDRQLRRVRCSPSRAPTSVGAHDQPGHGRGDGHAQLIWRRSPRSTTTCSTTAPPGRWRAMTMARRSR